MKRFLTSAVIVALIAGATAMTITDSASARGFSRSGTIMGARGRSATYSGQVTRGGGQASGTRSIQGSEGRGATASFNRSCAQGSGCTRDATLTTNSGKTWTRDGSVQPTGDGGYTGSVTTTGPNGGEVTRSGSVTVTPPPSN